MIRGPTFGRREHRAARAREHRGNSYFTEAFTVRQWRTLNTLHLRYERSQDLLGTHEMQRLEFVRWLYRMGRISS